MSVSHWKTTLLICACALAFCQPASTTKKHPHQVSYSDTLEIHDPVMANENGRYYLFSTWPGVSMYSSPDMHTWHQEASPLTPIPNWALNAIAAYDGYTWAPDIVRHNNRWYLYYSCSTFGQNISVIGVTTTKSLDPDTAHWEDLGLVIQSFPEVSDWNAIDPNVIIDEQGQPWLTFGSFWDGIQLCRLDNDMKTPLNAPVTIARRLKPDRFPHFSPHATGNAIEGPFIIHHDGFYYLFVSYDFCCRGLLSNYKTAVGRSKTVDGPYLDKDGVDMRIGGGTVLIAETSRYAGVGHCAVYDIDGHTLFMAHAYDKLHDGESHLFISRISWQDGWPVIASPSSNQLK